MSSSTQVAARALTPWWWSLSRSWPSLYAAGTVVLGIRPVFGCPCPLPGCRRTQRSVGAAPLFSFHLPLGSAGFHRFHRYYEEIRLLLGHGVVVVASFNTSTFVDPKRSPWVRMNGFPPLPSSIPSCHDWISGVALTSTFAQTRRPYKASLSLGAAVSLRLPSHTPSRERSVQALAGSGLMQLPTIYGCLQLAPYGTCTRRHSSMPGAHSRPTGSFRSRRGLYLLEDFGPRSQQTIRFERAGGGDLRGKALAKRLFLIIDSCSFLSLPSNSPLAPLRCLLGWLFGARRWPGLASIGLGDAGL